MVDDVHGYTCVVIGWESGDEAMCVGKMSFVMGRIGGDVCIQRYVDD